MTYLTIQNSDGDVLCRITDEHPASEWWASGGVVPDARGIEQLRKEPDSNYWPENVVVVLKVEDV